MVTRSCEVVLVWIDSAPPVTTNSAGETNSKPAAGLPGSTGLMPPCPIDCSSTLTSAASGTTDDWTGSEGTGAPTSTSTGVGKVLEVVPAPGSGTAPWSATGTSSSVSRGIALAVPPLGSGFPTASSATLTSPGFVTSILSLLDRVLISSYSPPYPSILASSPASLRGRN